MVNQSTADPSLDLVFHALADPTRRAILARLAQGSATVSELGQPFAISAPAITKHLKVLERAGLLQRTVDGRVHRCELDPQPMRWAHEWIEKYRRFWSAQLDRLGAFLADTAPDPFADPDPGTPGEDRDEDPGEPGPTTGAPPTDDDSEPSSPTEGPAAP